MQSFIFSCFEEFQTTSCNRESMAEPKSSAAGSRMLQILSIFKENGYSVIFSSAAKRSEYSFKLSKIGIQEQEIELNSSMFDRFVKT